MAHYPDYAQFEQIHFLDELYESYTKDRSSVEPGWRYFFDGLDLGLGSSFDALGPEGQKSLAVYRLIRAYRENGHLLAKLDPLSEPQKVKELDLEFLGLSELLKGGLFPSFGFAKEKEAPLEEIVQGLKKVYCGSIGFEYMDCQNKELQLWIQKEIEPQGRRSFSQEEKKELFQSLIDVENFEAFLHGKYLGQTRFSLEGLETMVPFVLRLLKALCEEGAKELVLGMAHRGRLSILKHVFQKRASLICSEFEDDLALSLFGNDDVKYHMGFVSELFFSSQKKIQIHMAPNPSHLESVNPVVLGEVFAKQFLQKENKEQIAALLIHGDASMAGQGVMYETMQLMHLDAYSVGGTIHLVANNQIGYTASPSEGRSTRYCTDIAKAFLCPVFHVNAEDAEGALFVADLAAKIRNKFKIDVFIDLIGYRKHGHNEGDEPSFTQPKQYEIIRSKKKISEIYAEGLFQKEEIETLQEKSKEKIHKEVLEKKETPSLEKKETSKQTISTQVSKEALEAILQKFCKIPEGFSLHPKLQKWVEARKKILEGPIDWAAAEMLSFASLLEEEVPIRLSGQDSQRGTFAQRHLVWIDHQNGKPYSPLSVFKESFQVINSLLSEFAGMAFEYGYSASVQKGLNLWEAQYGDFNNGAQILIDQYLVSGEKKWNRQSSLVLLLPHGYEGQGPEHSSARLERFLQLVSENNIRIAYPSTPSQYFHLLRRQAKEEEKKPLILLAPKSLLRSKENVSSLEDFTKRGFQKVLSDPIKDAKRVLLCTGKVFYDLLSARKQESVAIVRVEELYPLDTSFLKEVVSKYKSASQIFWVQEEPQNMGAWSYMAPLLQELFKEVIYVGRKGDATTATGSGKKHKQEQALVMEEAFKGL